VKVTKDGLKAGLTAAVALVIGTAVARGLPHRAAAPPPPDGGGGGPPAAVYDVLIVLVIGGLVAWAIHLRHRRNLRELHIKAAELDGFFNVKHSQLGDLWRCPDCHALILLADIDDHQSESACAEYVARLAEPGAADDAPAAGQEGYRAEQVTAAATVPPEHSITGGDIDSFRELD
jgi:hypothetical protein